MAEAAGGLGWPRSLAGNATLVCGKRRITVFRRGKGWKYALSEASGHAGAQFSRTYKTEDAAKLAALKAVGRK